MVTENSWSCHWSIWMILQKSKNFITEWVNKYVCIRCRWGSYYSYYSYNNYKVLEKQWIVGGSISSQQVIFINIYFLTSYVWLKLAEVSCPKNSIHIALWVANSCKVEVFWEGHKIFDEINLFFDIFYGCNKTWIQISCQS